MGRSGGARRAGRRAGDCHAGRRAGAGALPGRPQNFTATAGDTQVVLTWDAPASAGGAAITAYQYRTAVGATVPESHSWIQLDGADSREATVPGLTNGTQYAFEVRAKNRNIGGEGPVATATATPVADVTLTWDAREAGLEPSFTVTITFLEAVEDFTLDDISVNAINISDLFEEPGAFHQWELPAENFQGSGTTYSVKVTPEHSHDHRRSGGTERQESSNHRGRALSSLLMRPRWPMGKPRKGEPRKNAR